MEDNIEDDNTITSICVTDQFGEYSITREGNFNHISKFINNFIVPTLKAMGYGDKTIKEYIETDMLWYIKTIIEDCHLGLWILCSRNIKKPDESHYG